MVAPISVGRGLRRRAPDLVVGRITGTLRAVVVWASGRPCRHARWVLVLIRRANAGVRRLPLSRQTLAALIVIDAAIGLLAAIGVVACVHVLGCLWWFCRQTAGQRESNPADCDTPFHR